MSFWWNMNSYSNVHSKNDATASGHSTAVPLSVLLLWLVELGLI